MPVTLFYSVKEDDGKKIMVINCEDNITLGGGAPATGEYTKEK